MKKLFFISFLFLNVVAFSQDLISGGSNSWIFHTPDRGERDLHIAPTNSNNTDWDWNNRITMTNDGILKTPKSIVVGNSFLEPLSGNDSSISFCPNNGTSWFHIKNSSNNSLEISQGANVDGQKLVVIKNNGNFGIGSQNPDSRLTVKGKIHCEEVKVDLQVPADYVFEKYYTGTSILKADYKMFTLEEVEEFIKKNNHLPEVPSAKQIKEEGLHLKEMTNLLLQKIEELTLYTIEQEKRIKKLESQIEKIKS